ncbi:hypothetical protein [Streptomyces erythrochromogenes]|uniref:hypothetical protein n=1 Tax=Streptomyces erythrochromogenes TaxID=285574 RepID=UPI00341B285A
MSNPNKAKGTAWESAIRDYLNYELDLVNDYGTFFDPMSGENIRRAAQEGSRDVGDIHAAPFVLEAKNTKRPAVPTWIRQAEREAEHAGFPYGLVVRKVRLQHTHMGRVHVSVRTWTRIRLALGMSTSAFRELYGWSVSLRGLDTSRWYLTTTVRELADLIRDYRRTVPGVSARALR